MEENKRAYEVPPGPDAARVITQLLSAHKGKIITCLLSTLGAAAGAGYVAAKGVAKDAVEKAATQGYVDALAKKSEFQAAVAGVSGSPVGCVVAWPAAVPPPEGWQVCKGQEIDAKVEDAIYKVLGETYGKAGNGKVKIPDFQGHFLRGMGCGSGGFGVAQAAAVSPADISWTEKGDPNQLASDGHHVPWPKKVMYSPGGETISVIEAVFHRKAGNGVEVSHSDTRPTNYAIHWIIRVR